MKRTYHILQTLGLGLLLGISLLSTASCSSQNTSVSPDVTSSITKLGNPYQKKYPGGGAIYSRNIWDMQLFNGKIFLGAGNSSNQGPSHNSGPVPILVFYPDQKKFVMEEEVADEQIDRYRVLNDKLYIPGHDATGSWRWGNFYQRTKEGKWSMYRNVPKALHLYDLVFYNGKLLVGIGLKGGAAVGITENMGKTWRIIPMGRHRIYSFMQFGDTLYALNKFTNADKPHAGVVEYLPDGNFTARFDISFFRMFPETAFTQKFARATRMLKIGDENLYIGAFEYNDHQTLPFGLFTAKMENRMLSATRVHLPKGLIPRDLLVRDSHVYLLASIPKGRGYEVKILEASTQNLLEWKELFHFDYPAFARSFEYAQDAFYFGVGCDINPQDWTADDLPKETGDILRVPYRMKGIQ